MAACCSACMAEGDRKSCIQISPIPEGESRTRVAASFSPFLHLIFTRPATEPALGLDTPFLSRDAFLSSIRRSKSRPRCAERHTRVTAESGAQEYN
eukprot:2531468-Pleurochrysis_carterae.AAC.2